MPPAAGDDDLTRKERREQARANRRALEQAELQATVRRKRLAQLGILAAIVIVAIVIIAVAAGGGGGAKKFGGANSEEKTIDHEVAQLINGVPQQGNTLGSPTAPVTLVYFGDLECPICREFTLGALPSIIEKWVRTGKVRIEYRSLETATREPETFRKQQADALAAGKQQKMWYFVETFYHEQGQEDTGYVNEAYLQNIAQQVPGLNLAKWASQSQEPAFLKQIEADQQLAGTEAFDGTPSFLLGRTGGTLKKFEAGSLTESGSFDSAIESLLKE